jgi:hypothetical protein
MKHEILPAIFLFEIGTQLRHTRAWVMTCQVSHWGIWGKRTYCRIGHGVVRREGCGFITIIIVSKIHIHPWI